MTSLTPEALRSLCERLTEEYSPEREEAAAAIAGLVEERAQIIAARDQHFAQALDNGGKANEYEAKLREIENRADYCLLDGHTFDGLQSNLRQILAIARTSPAGEKK